jgi:hypothetical protein
MEAQEKRAKVEKRREGNEGWNSGGDDGGFGNPAVEEDVFSDVWR